MSQSHPNEEFTSLQLPLAGIAVQGSNPHVELNVRHVPIMVFTYTCTLLLIFVYCRNHFTWDTPALLSAKARTKIHM
ncbi:hypothetical protein IW261DRAFT_1555699 [Armillaria novae-zelandiae]|uniref:Transmembrane protein n=1 Tax=Armillaria novae-zelandiae TaxID=153914 RepID=A0AA39UIA8_9AGAR|nr:hypothetical protein IW261DRAFT_1555699 [Armillaria novae-zelandiae]